MTPIASILLAALTVLVASSSNALAGGAPVPEPSTLAILAVGVGALAGVKYFTRKQPEQTAGERANRT